MLCVTMNEGNVDTLFWQILAAIKNYSVYYNSTSLITILKLTDNETRIHEISSKSNFSNITSPEDNMNCTKGKS